MEDMVTDVHQVGPAMVHLAWERIEDSTDYLAYFEGSGVCLANTFPTRFAAELWLKRLFKEMFPSHNCGLGCMRFPEAEFLAHPEALRRLSVIENRQVG